MTEVTSHAPGAFCWVELGTTDQNAAKEFYGKLFGWSFTDMSIGGRAVPLARILRRGRL
jgi:predicted enzyme related to lactoylglutathione lyase